MPEDKRIVLCPRRTWCVLHKDHPGGCEEVPRYEIPRSDFGAEAAKRRRW